MNGNTEDFVNTLKANELPKLIKAQFPSDGPLHFMREIVNPSRVQSTGRVSRIGYPEEAACAVSPGWDQRGMPVTRT